MRYTRYEFSWGKKVWLRVIIWLAAIMLLYAVVVKLIISNLAAVPEISGNGGDAGSKAGGLGYRKFEPVKYYVIQMGAFASSENAESFSDRLRTNSIPAYIRKVEKLSIVVTFVSAQKSECIEKSDEMRSKGYETITIELQISPCDFSEELKQKDSYLLLNKTVNDACDAVKNIMGIADNSELSDADFINVNDILNGLETNIMSSISTLGTYTQEDKALPEEIMKRFDDSIKLLSGKMTIEKDEIKGSDIPVKEAALGLVYSFFDFVGEINQYVKGNGQQGSYY